MAEIASFGVNVDQNTRLAQNAQDTADTIGTVLFAGTVTMSTTAPSDPSEGDIWYQEASDGSILGVFAYDGSQWNTTDYVKNLYGVNIYGATLTTPTLSLGLNGTFTESYDYTQQASMFLPKNSNGTLTFNHGVLQSTGHMQTYNGSQWGGMNDSLVFQSGIDNAQWTEVAPGYLKMDLYTQGSNPNVLQRAYADPTGYYYTDITGHYTYLGNILNTQQVQAPSIFTTALFQFTHP